MSRFLAKRPLPGGRRRWVFGIAAAAVVAMGVFITSAFGVLAGSPSKFEANDGNMVVNTTGNNDWKTVNFFHLSDVSNSTGDDSFVSGQKQDTACPDVDTHKNPPKDDFTDIASYNDTNTTASSPQYLHTFLYGATIRYAANGNASENVELKQGTNGNCTNGLLARTTGDKLIAIDYLGGGATGTGQPGRYRRGGQPDQRPGPRGGAVRGVRCRPDGCGNHPGAFDDHSV